MVTGTNYLSIFPPWLLQTKVEKFEIWQIFQMPEVYGGKIYAEVKKCKICLMMQTYREVVSRNSSEQTLQNKMPILGIRTLFSERWE